MDLFLQTQRLAGGNRNESRVFVSVGGPMGNNLSGSQEEVDFTVYHSLDQVHLYLLGLTNKQPSVYF